MTNKERYESIKTNIECLKEVFETLIEINDLSLVIPKQGLSLTESILKSYEKLEIK